MDRPALALRLSLAVMTFGASGSAFAQDNPPVPQPPPVTVAPAPAVAAALSRPPAAEPQPLPSIPPAPTGTLPEYPNCREDHASVTGRVRKANRVRACLVRLNQYNSDILQVFARRMDSYRESLRALWGQVNDGPYTFQQKREFYDRISVEFENSKRDGSYMDQFRLIQGRYLADSSYLRTEYCNLVTCPRTPQ